MSPVLAPPAVWPVGAVPHVPERVPSGWKASDGAADLKAAVGRTARRGIR